MAGNKVIVTVAPTGGMAKKSQNPHLPTQPDEIAESVYRSYNAGASVVALHARRPDDQATCNADIYRRINSLVREKCDIVINNSTGGGVDGDMLIPRKDGLFDIDFEERLKGLDAGAEMATFDCFTVAAMYGNYEMLVSTTPNQCQRMAAKFVERGIKPEWEVFNPAHILQGVNSLITTCDKPPYFVNIVLNVDRGFQGALPYTPDILQMMVKLLPKDSIFNVSAVGTSQLPATTHALLLGGHVRVGLEDNLYYAKGDHATNERLVERQVRIVRELGFEPATPAEARQMMGLA